MFKYAIVACLLCIANAVHAFAPKFKPAILFTASGDSLHGMIDDAALKSSGQSVYFLDGNNTTHTYQASDIKGFYLIDAAETYISSTVLVDQASTNYDKANRLIDSVVAPVEKSIFLLELVKSSSLSLYSYEDGERIHFFYTNNNSQPVELIYHYANRNGYLQTDDTYKKQLSALSPLCSDARTMINNLHYVEKEIKKVTAMLIRCNNPATLTNIRKDTRLPLHFGIVAGVANNAFNITGKGPVYSDNFSTIALDNYKSNTSPIIGVGMDLTLLKRSERLHLVNELIYKNYRSGASGFTHTVLNDYTNQVEISFSYVQLNTLVRYNLVKGNNVKPFINIGMGNAIKVAAAKNTNELTYDNGTKKTYTAYDDPQSYETNFLAGAGVYAGKFSAEFRYSAGNGFSAYQMLRSKVSSMQLIASFYF